MRICIIITIMVIVVASRLINQSCFSLCFFPWLFVELRHNESPNEKSNPKVPRTRTSVESEFSKTSKQSLLTGEEKSTTNPIFGFRGKKNRGNGSGGDIEANEL